MCVCVRRVHRNWPHCVKVNTHTQTELLLVVVVVIGAGADGGGGGSSTHRRSVRARVLRTGYSVVAPAPNNQSPQFLPRARLLLCVRIRALSSRDTIIHTYIQIYM